MKDPRKTLKYKFYDFIRWLFWSDYDKNEDFICGYCGKPVFRRYIYCSKWCAGIDEIKQQLNL